MTKLSHVYGRLCDEIGLQLGDITRVTADNNSVTESRASISEALASEGAMSLPKEHQQDFFRVLKYFRRNWKAQDVTPQMKISAQDYHNLRSLEEVVRSVRLLCMIVSTAIGYSKNL